MRKLFFISSLLILSVFTYAQDTFNLVTDNFNSIDVSNASAPSFNDLDGDGLLDLLIGKNDGHISHYEQNAVNSISFTYRTSTFNSIDVGYYSSPTLTDLDGDGFLDLLIGELGGNINHYEQNSVNSTSFHLVTINFNSIDVGGRSVPTFTDLDDDNLLDMFVGASSGNINHYEQNAVNSTSFTLVTSTFNAIKVGDKSAPTFTDLDSDGLLDMLIGENVGNISHYEQNAVNSTSFTLVTSAFNAIDVGDFSTPTFTDLDGDGFLDMLIGESSGNINHYEEIPYIAADFSVSYTPGHVPVEVQFTDISYCNISDTWDCV